MKYKKHYNILYKILYLILLLLFVYLAIRFIYGLSISKKNTFVSGQLSPDKYPTSNPVLATQYPYSGHKNVSNDNYNSIWWKYPVFREGSYKQITNNLRYYKNPDEGTCISAAFCGALYKDKKNKSNVINPLPPVPNGKGARVNYYRAQPNMLL